MYSQVIVFILMLAIVAFAVFLGMLLANMYRGRLVPEAKKIYCRLGFHLRNDFTGDDYKGVFTCKDCGFQENTNPYM